MKLYEVPRNTWVKCIEPQCESLEFKLHNIDGMYSYCTDRNNEVYHCVAWMEVEIMEDQNGT